MYENALKIFLEICKIPHNSFYTGELKEWLTNEAKKRGASVASDRAGNLLVSKGKPSVCLQGHYDMVGVGGAAGKGGIKTILEGGVLKAEDSSLGADNGAALACMLELLSVSEHLECLMTNDEEVGMIGAKNLEVLPQSAFIINCDSEEINEIVVGCAGGFDLIAARRLEGRERQGGVTFYHICTQGFLGGHSGVDIHKNIANALVALAEYLEAIPCVIAGMSGGEKRNSIPVNAEAIIGVACGVTLPQNQHFCVKPIDFRGSVYEKAAILNPILECKIGVLEVNAQKEVISSRNLGIIKLDHGVLELHFMGRANDNSRLEENQNSLRDFFVKKGFSATITDTYGAWSEEGSSGVLEKITQEVHAQILPKTTLKTIHAGLECGILKAKLPKAEFVSIGPTIMRPHSVYECLDLESFRQFYTLLSRLVRAI